MGSECDFTCRDFIIMINCSESDTNNDLPQVDVI
jgi:hypothetical protein